MRIAYFSDLQLDHPRAAPILPFFDPDEADVLVVAGDLHPPLHRSLRTLGQFSKRLPVIYAAGNRDFYGTSWDREIAEARELAKEYDVHFLEGTFVHVDGVCFVGSTLWTNHQLPGSQADAAAVAERSINDHRHIRLSNPERLWSAADAALRHELARAFIQHTLETQADPVVVVSHHAPHSSSIAPLYDGSPLNGAFASDCSDLMAGPHAPALWIHGGLHHNVDYRVGETRIVSNSCGYVGENPHFEGVAVVEVARDGAQ